MATLSELLEEKGVDIKVSNIYILFGSDTKCTEIVTWDGYFYKQHYTAHSELLWIFGIITKEFHEDDRIYINIIKTNKNLHIYFSTLFKKNYHGKFFINMIKI